MLSILSYIIIGVIASLFLFAVLAPILSDIKKYFT